MMRTFSRLTVLSFFVLLAIIAAAVALTSWHQGVSLVMFDHDYSESVLAWMIAIPAIFLVMVLVAAMLVFCGLLVAGAIALAMLLAILAVGLALLPLGLFLAIPALVVYGIFKLIQRDRMPA